MIILLYFSSKIRLQGFSRLLTVSLTLLDVMTVCALYRHVTVRMTDDCMK